MLDSSISRKLTVLVVVLIASIMASVVAFSSGGVMATSLSIDSGSVTTDNGTIESVSVDASGTITYDGAEQAPGDTQVKLKLQDKDGSGYQTIDSINLNLDGTAGSESYSFSNVEVTGQQNYDASSFKSDDDGAEKTTDIKFKIEIVSQGDVDGDGSNPDTSSAVSSTYITVNNEASSQNVGGSGDVTASGTNQEP